MLGQLVHVRVALAAAQLVGTFGVAGGVGGWVAVDQAHRGVSGAETELKAADTEFRAQLNRSASDGTPAEKLADLSVRETKLVARPKPAATFVVDRQVIMELGRRTADIRRMTIDVALREVDEEVSLNEQLRAALEAMAQDLVAARNAGIDTSTYVAAYQQGEAAAGREQIPRLASKSIQDLKTQDAALVAATAGRVAYISALQAASDNAGYQRSRALGDLAQARAIPVLDVTAVAAAIADLESRFPSATTPDDFNNLAAGYAADAATLENLLYSRSNAYSLLASARYELGLAQGAGADVTSDAAKINALATQLDAASNLAAIQAVEGPLSFLIRDLVGLYRAAKSRPFTPAGAIVDGVPFIHQVYSLSCEAASLEMALMYYGHNVSQDDILNYFTVDRTLPSRSPSGSLIWGNPYKSFVGNYNGYENADSGSLSGYGVYYPRVAAAGNYFGAYVAQAGEVIAPSTIYAAAKNRQPVVVWVAFAYQPHPMQYMAAYDGTQNIMYGAPWEHAVTISGWAPGYVLINNPDTHPEWIDDSTFEAAYAMFNHMAVIFSNPPPPQPSPAPAPSASPKPSPSP
ncbi:MAG TPA: C39 family peptidase [Candidatus Solibacter sp.]|nr:C39 family peptidase [Candidatus Solibacter sp.]